MRSAELKIVILLLVFVTSCKTVKKAAPAQPEVKTSAASDNSYLFNMAPNGIREPLVEDLVRVQSRYPDLTIQVLNEGHLLYSKGACVSCHTAQNIYSYNEGQWKKIIDDMAFRANISEEQKDAVFKYVMTMKAIQPN
jgi:hypothetical protein